MKKLKRVLYTAVFTAGAVQLAACTPRPETVYGPPEYFERPNGGTGNETTEEIPEAVYGPPEYFGIQEDPTESAPYRPEDEIPEEVYGPPEYFGTLPEEEQEEEEIPVALYGPPEYFSQQKAAPLEADGKN